MKMKCLLLLVAVGVSLTNTYCQVPGFQGKRFMASAELNIFGRWADHGYKDYDQLYKFSDLATKKGFRLEYVLSRSWNVGIGYDQMNLGVISVSNYNIQSFTSMFPKLNQFRGYMALRDKSIGIHVKKFPFRKSGQLAPLGTFVTASYNRRFGKLVHLDTDNTGEILKDYTELTKYNTWSIMGGFGRQYVFYNIVTFKVAFEMGFNPAVFRGPAAASSGFYANGEKTEEEHLNELAVQRLAPGILYHLSIGVGVLAF